MLRADLCGRGEVDEVVGVFEHPQAEHFGHHLERLYAEEFGQLSDFDVVRHEYRFPGSPGSNRGCCAIDALARNPARVECIAAESTVKH